jgi:hypothetical protein
MTLLDASDATLQLIDAELSAPVDEHRCEWCDAQVAEHQRWCDYHCRFMAWRDRREG